MALRHCGLVVLRFSGTFKNGKGAQVALCSGASESLARLETPQNVYIKHVYGRPFKANVPSSGVRPR